MQKLDKNQIGISKYMVQMKLSDKDGELLEEWKRNTGLSRSGLARKILLAGLITLEEARTNADVTLEEGSPLASLLTLSNERGGGSSRYQPTQERLEKLEAKNARLEKAMRVLVGDSAAPIKESDDGVEEHWSKTMSGLAKDNKDDELKSACRAMLSFDDDKI